MAAYPTASAYNETYECYLEQLATKRFDGKEDVLGIALDGESVVVPYFGTFIRLSDEGLKDNTGQRPDFADCVVVCRYLIMCPLFEPRQKAWTAYRDFPDAGPLTVFWADTVERPLAKTFSGNTIALEEACDRLGGIDANMEIACDLCRKFIPLPKVPLLLIFNDADSDFPASVSLLFQKRASTYLDGESLAILGHILSKRLLQSVLKR